jgi:WD repeat-containing protein 34
MGFLANIYDNRQTQKIKDIVDKHMLNRPSGPRQVYANHIFGAKPPIHMIYPPFNSKQFTNYDKHHGPVLGVATSPFNKRLFLTCSSDSSIRLYDVQDKKAVASFEPCFGEYLLCVQWSPFRPCVFACVSNAGTLYIYDLVRSK